MQYSTSETMQLFKSTLNSRVLMIELTDSGLFKLTEDVEVTMNEMINCHWEPIEHSDYIGLN